jgi:hypothetical protein
MKGDFSKLRFERKSHYTSVLEQQGRVALDSDHNEQRAIDEYLRAVETLDVIGPFGGPIGDAGFAISISGNTLQIGDGRYYVNGVLCENESPLSYAAQPYLINPAISDSQLLTDLANGRIDSIRVFLEVWRRMVTGLDDPCLREPALGPADTTTRLQTVWRVVAVRIAKPTLQPPPFPSPAGLNIALVNRASALSLLFQPADAAVLANPPAATLGPVGTTVSPAPASATLGPAGTTAPPTPAAAAPDCCTQMYTPVAQPAPGKLSAQTSGASSDCSCQPTPAAGYRGLENQLYRVEVHRGGNESTATFKWSRENASVVCSVLSASGADVIVDSLGPDMNLGLQPGQWVELSDDTELFGPTPNQPGALFQIKSITPEQRIVTLTTPVSAVDPRRNARLRRWEQFGTSATANAVALSTASWFELENGVQVRFAAGDFQPGDYWLITARTATGQIEWPPCGSDGAAFQPPHRVPIYRAPLACIHWDAKTQKPLIDDCRRLFPPLTSVAPGAASNAIHATSINWSNDDLMTFEQLIQNGLIVSVDQPVTGLVDSGNFSVTFEAAMASKVESIVIADKLAPIVLRVEMALDGTVTVQPSSITWMFPFDPTKGGSFRHVQTVDLINNLLQQGLDYGAFARVRVRLLGEKIAGGAANNPLYLDGNTFAKPGTRADHVTPRTDLIFPTGGESKASDFESWFYLAPILRLLSLTLAPTAVTVNATNPNPAVTATLTVNYPPLADTVVNVSVTPPAGALAAVTAPPQVTVLKGQSTAQFPLRVSNTTAQTALNYQIVATLPSKIGLPTTQIATLAVTGFVVLV